MAAPSGARHTSSGCRSLASTAKWIAALSLVKRPPTSPLRSETTHHQCPSAGKSGPRKPSSSRQPGTPQAFAQPFGVLVPPQVQRIDEPVHILPRTRRRIAPPTLADRRNRGAGTSLRLLDAPQMTASCRTQGEVSRVPPHRRVRYEALQKVSRFPIPPEPEQDVRMIIIVPVGVTWIEPKGDLSRRQSLLRLSQARLHPRPKDLDQRIVRVHSPRKVHVPLGPVEVTPHQAHVSEHGVHPRIVGILRQRLFGLAQRVNPILILSSRHPDIVLDRTVQANPGQPRMSPRKARVDLERPAEKVPAPSPGPRA